MDNDLNSALTLIKSDIRVKYVNTSSTDMSHGYGELIIARYKLENCPDIPKILNRLEKKISKTSALRAYSNTRHLCILILASVGYGINASVFESIPDTFIEKCWECIQYISFNITNPLKDWLIQCMDGRNPPSFSALFCPPKRLPERIPVETKFTDKLNSVHQLDASVINMPNIMWHKDDILTQTMLAHIRLQSKFFELHSEN